MKGIAVVPGITQVRLVGRSEPSIPSPDEPACPPHHNPLPEGKGLRVEFQHPLHREEYIRIKDRIIIAVSHPRHSSIPLFCSLILLFAGFHGAS